MRRSPAFVIPLFAASALAGCGGGGAPSAPAAPAVISIAGLPAGDTLSAVTQYALSIITEGGATVSADNATFELDTPAVGTISGAILTTGAADATGSITATDTANGLRTTVRVAVGSTHPATAGDTARFTGELAETIVRPQPAPSASQPPYAFRYAVTIASTTSTGKVFNGKANLTDFTTVETDSGALPPIPVTTTDTFESLVSAPGGLVRVVSYGTQASDSNGVTYRTALGNGNGLLDILPEISGRTWRNNAAEDDTETDPDSTTIARSQNAAGAYTETDTFADRSLDPATIAVNADLSGTYDNANVFGGLSAPASLTFGAPRPSSGGYVIPLSVVEGGVTQTGELAEWYPAQTLYADSVRTVTGEPLPAACGAAPATGSKANATVEVTTRLDPVLGTYETRRDATYLVTFYGPVCTILTDTLEDYYDYSGQSANPLGSVLQQTTKLSETLGFASGTIAGSARVRGAFELGRASFARAVTRLYDERRRALGRFARHASLRSMGVMGGARAR